MAQKKVEIAGVGTVTLIKTARNRNLRLTITTAGVRVSLPRWSSFAVAAEFATANSAWIQQEVASRQTVTLQQGQRIGSRRYLRFAVSLNTPATTTRLTTNEVLINMLPNEQSTDPAVQQRAFKAAVRALRQEAEFRLPPRLRALAEQHGLPFKSVSIKQLRRRWGSCSSEQDIALNLFLVELPTAYVDYVLLHELAHTKHMNHGADFWQLLTELEPNARMLAKRLRRHQPTIGNWNPDTIAR